MHEFRRGAVPESILRSFPLIGSLERVYGAIAYYLGRREEIDEYLNQQARRFEEERSRQVLPAGLKKRLDIARAGSGYSRLGEVELR